MEHNGLNSGSFLWFGRSVGCRRSGNFVARQIRRFANRKDADVALTRIHPISAPLEKREVEKQRKWFSRAKPTSQFDRNLQPAFSFPPLSFCFATSSSVLEFHFPPRRDTVSLLRACRIFSTKRGSLSLPVSPLFRIFNVTRRSFWLLS